MFPAQRGTGNKDLREAPRTGGPAFDLFLPFVIGSSLYRCQGGLFPRVVAVFFSGLRDRSRCLCLFVQIRVRTRGAEPGHH